MFRSILAAGGIALALGLIELLLFVIDEPRQYPAPQRTAQFSLYAAQDADFLLYTNTPSQQIQITYADNPRGYFDRSNAVLHTTNSWGFRGPEFQSNHRDRTLRIAFLGDSFTFGEGVRDQEIYPELVRALLTERFKSQPVEFESYDFAVGSYNTVQELHTLKHRALLAHPDAVVVGYTINDAEPFTFEKDPAHSGFVLHDEEMLKDPWPPDSLLYRFRLARFIWRHFALKSRTEWWIAHYRSLYTDQNPFWSRTRDAMREIADICRANGMPLYVVIFPNLVRLDDGYPFTDVHHTAAREWTSAGAAAVLDVLPLLQGRNTESLWVHATDHHPNQIVHRLVAEALTSLLASHSSFRDRVESASHGPYNPPP